MSFVVESLVPIAQNIDGIRKRIAAAARRAGRNPGEIALMAVTKTVSPDRIVEAFAAGVRLFGENRVQEFAAKRAQLAPIIESGAEFHMIGHLQSNKAAKATELFAAVDSVDSLALARKLNVAAENDKCILPVLIEINPRVTMAYVGLSAALNRNLATAVLAAHHREAVHADA